VAESRQPLHAISDETLGGALREMGSWVAFPSADSEGGRPDVAALARARIVALDIQPSGGGTRRWFGLGVRPMRRGLVLAVAALLVLAAIAGAIGFGLPGLRIIFGDIPSQPPVASATPAGSGSASAAPSASATPGPLGSGLGLGVVFPLADAEARGGFDLILPPDPAIGPPDVAWVTGRRVNLVWASSPVLPAADASGVGLLISEFQGHVDPGLYQKFIDTGTKLTPVTVNGSPGYWISGEPHFFFYIDPEGNSVDDTHRQVGDTLIWSTGEVTYRLESALDMDAAIQLAESLR
jgi:hypothetical protein